MPLRELVAYVTSVLVASVVVEKQLIVSLPVGSGWIESCSFVSETQVVLLGVGLVTYALVRL